MFVSVLAVRVVTAPNSSVHVKIVHWALRVITSCACLHLATKIQQMDIKVKLMCSQCHITESLQSDE